MSTRNIPFGFCELLYREAPEATGDEPEDADFETPKVYELVRQTKWRLSYLCYFSSSVFSSLITPSQQIPAEEEINS